MKIEVNTGIITDIRLGHIPKGITQTNLWKTKIDNLLRNDYSYLYSNKELSIDLIIYENTDVFSELKDMLLNNKDNESKDKIIKYLNDITFKYLDYESIKEVVLETNKFSYLKGKHDKMLEFRKVLDLPLINNHGEI